MNRVEDLINSAKTNELLGELLHIKKEEEKKSNVLMWVAITLGAVLAVAGIAYAVYRFFTPDYPMSDFFEFCKRCKHALDPIFFKIYLTSKSRPPS